MESDLESVGELACSVLFDAIINWCEYADANNLEGDLFICIFNRRRFYRRNLHPQPPDVPLVGSPTIGVGR